MSFGLSSGNIPLVNILTSGSEKRSLTVGKPIASITSVNMILTKIRLEDVVASSVIWIVCSTAQEIASFARRCPKSRAMLRRRFVS